MRLAGFVLVAALSHFGRDRRRRPGRPGGGRGWVDQPDDDRSLEEVRPRLDHHLRGRSEARPGEGDASQGRAVKDGTTWLNGEKGRLPNLITQEAFGDCEVHVEFLIAKRSNAGIKFHEVYEIQILDSFGKKDIDGTGMGGVYPRADTKKGGYLDRGIAPKVNAAKPAGEWNTLDVVWKSPRFDAKGEKTDKRDDREGDAQRAGDPRERRGEDADRRELDARRKPRPAPSCSSPTTAQRRGGT